MRCSALLLFAALPLAGCPEKTQDDAQLPPAGLAGGGAVAGGAPAGSATMPGAPAAGAPQGHAAPTAAPHPPMGSPHSGAASPGPSSQPAAPTVVPGGGADAAAAAAELSGTVAEAHHVKEYTYIRVKEASGNESWAAVLKDESINVGTKISLGKDVWMTDFQSPSLGKSFDRILFGRVLTKQ